MRCPLFIPLLLAVAAFGCQQQADGHIQSATAAATPASTTAEKPQAVKEKLYVHAANGLVLRKTPDKNGEKIATLAYRTSVDVLQTATTAGYFVAERFDGQNIEGPWLRVLSPEGQEGYVFGGYLSRHPPTTVFSSDVEPLDQFYRGISPIRGGHEKTMQDHALDGYVQHYADGAHFDAGYFPGGVAYLLDIPPGKLNLQEAFVMLRSFVFSSPADVRSSFDREKNAFVAVHEAEGYTNLIVSQKPDGGIAVELSFPD